MISSFEKMKIVIAGTTTQKIVTVRTLMRISWRTELNSQI